MGKPTDPGDSTQPLSESQVVAVKPPKPPIAPGDQSVAWKGTVVGADDFAPVAKKSRAKLAAVGVVGALVVGGGAYALWPSSGAKPAATAPADSASNGSAGSGGAAAGSGATGSAASAPPPLPADAAPAADAAAPPVDAGAPPDAPAKPAVKKPVKKKPVPVKKKR